MSCLLRSWTDDVVISGLAVAHSGEAGDLPEVRMDVSAPQDRGGPPGTNSPGLQTLLGAVTSTMDSLDESSMPSRTRRAIVVGSQLATFNETMAFAEGIKGTGPTLVSPALFPITVMNSIAGYVAIDRGFEGPNITICDNETSLLSTFVHAADLVTNSQATVVLACSFEAVSASVATTLGSEDSPFAIALCTVVSTASTAEQLGIKPLARILGYAASGSPEEPLQQGSRESQLFSAIESSIAATHPSAAFKKPRTIPTGCPLATPIMVVADTIFHLGEEHGGQIVETVGVFGPDDGVVLALATSDLQSQ